MPSPLLYDIRHCETEWNREGRLHGWRDVPINANDRHQAAVAAQSSRDLLARDAADPGQFDFVASPLGRACETMQLVRNQSPRVASTRTWEEVP